MLNQVILWSLQNRLVVLALAILLFVFGIRSAVQAPLDVFPDFAPPQVVIQTEAPGMSAEETEQLVTLPLETALMERQIWKRFALRPLSDWRFSHASFRPARIFSRLASLSPRNSNSPLLICPIPRASPK